MNWWIWAIGIYATAAIILGVGTVAGIAPLSVTGVAQQTLRPQIEITAFDWVFVGQTGVFFLNWTDMNLAPPAIVTVHIAGVASPTTTYTAVSSCPPSGPTPCSARITYTFPGAGTYTVNANITGRDLSGRVSVAAQTINHVITIVATSGSNGGGGSSATLVAKFTAIQTTGTLSVTFTDISVVNGATVNKGTVQWQFGDGTTGVGGSIIHVYSVSGRYSVTEQVSATLSTGATISNSTVHSVRVVPASCGSGSCSPNLQPGFSWTIGGTGLTVTFTDTSSVAAGSSIQTRSWNFGDGSTGAGTPVTHTYSAFGTYSVNETVVANLSTAVSTKSITESLTLTTLSTSGSGCTDLNCNGAAPASPLNITLAGTILLGSGIGFGLGLIIGKLDNYVIVIGLGVIGTAAGFFVGWIW